MSDRSASTPLDHPGRGGAGQSLPDVVVSIVSHGAEDYVGRCIEAVQDGTTTAPGIFIVDNVPTGTIAGWYEMSKGVTVHENAVPLGFGENQNQAFRATNSRYFVALNPDLVLDPGCLDTMKLFMDAHPETAICGPRIRDPHGRAEPPPRAVLDFGRDLFLVLAYISRVPRQRLDRWLHRLRSLRRLLHRRRLARVHAKTHEAHDMSPSSPLASYEAQLCEVLDGACLFVRRSAVPEGESLYDPRFFMYRERDDLCARMLADGWDIHWLPSCGGIHEGGASTRSDYRTYLGVFAYSNAQLYGKHQGAWREAVFRIAVATTSLVNAARWTVQRAFGAGDRDELSEWIDFSLRLARVILRSPENTSLPADLARVRG